MTKDNKKTPLAVTTAKSMADRAQLDYTIAKGQSELMAGIEAMMARPFVASDVDDMIKIVEDSGLGDWIVAGQLRHISTILAGTAQILSNEKDRTAAIITAYEKPPEVVEPEETDD